MSSTKFHTLRAAPFLMALSFIGAPALAQDTVDDPPPPPVAQQQPASPGGWRRVGDPPNRPNYPQDPNAAADRGYSQNQNQNQNPNYPPARRPDYSQDQNGDPNGPEYTVPSQLTIKPGTFITVRVNQTLSSDHNQPGDSFSATLIRPIVLDGVVVAQPGQTIGGRVADAQKAGRVEKVSRLGIELTDLTLVDGQQLPIHTQLIGRSGPTSVGQDVGTVAGTTALGAAIGAIAGRGMGAGIGAAAGAAAGTAGVLLTRGHATIIYPESLLTFRIEAPVTFSTERSAQAFRYVNPSDYDRSFEAQSAPVPRPESTCGPYGCPPPPPAYYGPTYYYGSPYPYYFGSGFSFFYGPRFYAGPRFYGGSRFYGGRGYYRGHRR